MQGIELREYEIQDFWTYLRIVSCIADEYLPKEPPTFAPHLALQQEFELGRLVYQISRSVPKITYDFNFKINKHP